MCYCFCFLIIWRLFFVNNRNSSDVSLSNQVLVYQSFVCFVTTFSHHFEILVGNLLSENIKLIVTGISKMILIGRFLKYKLTHFIDKGRLPAFKQSKYCSCLHSLTENKLMQIHLLVYIGLALFNKFLKLSGTIYFISTALATKKYLLNKTLQKADRFNFLHLAFQLLK